MTLIHSRIVEEGVAARWPSAYFSGKQESADYSNKQNSGSGRAVSLQPSLLAQADTGMRKPHSLLAMYASAAERQTCNHDWCG